LKEKKEKTLDFAFFKKKENRKSRKIPVNEPEKN